MADASDLQYDLDHENPNSGQGGGKIGGGASQKSVDNQDRHQVNHAQEFAKYGQIIAGSSRSVSGQVLKKGFMIEYGSVDTDKGWRQDFQTEYKISGGLAIAYGSGMFALFNRGNFHTTFTDFAGPVSGFSISIGVGTYSRQQSTTYSTYGISFGFGISLPKKINGAWVKGTTTLLGDPYLIGPSDGD